MLSIRRTVQPLAIPGALSALSCSDSLDDPGLSSSPTSLDFGELSAGESITLEVFDINEDSTNAFLDVERSLAGVFGGGGGTTETDASSMSIYMNSGGGGDNHILWGCCGSSGWGAWGH